MSNPQQQAHDSLLSNEFLNVPGDLGTLDSLEGSSIQFDVIDVNFASYIPGNQHLHSYTMNATNSFHQALNGAAEAFLSWKC